ncbi:MAG: dynamin family protein [Deltaproteobacteria bacterium]|nr:dynamin family protein [Deltaproteobacteria bacterium]
MIAAWVNTMDGYGIQKQAIQGINEGLLALFRTARSIPGLADYSFGDWEKTCAGLSAQLAEETIRVAVVGPIKSGKSTFLNSLLKGDFLKRGAGVVTAIVTRVRSGERLKATLYYKSWSEVNEDMEQALVLFPHQSWRSPEERFDIRRERERTGLQLALSTLNADQRISDDARNRNMVLLSCYLQGYATVSRFLTDQQTTRRYEDDRFIEHWNFSGNEALAVYLRDIQLDINSGSVGSNIEIADCQGSDSSNPLHLAMIQDYLRLAHLLIYVVSSRTGLRRADIKFLSMIKKMGILDNILFVLNCDFSEHQSFEDMKPLVERVSEELSLMKSGADVFAFSALFNLFRSQDGRVAEKDRQRFEHWKSDAEMVDFSDRETERFRSAFDEILSRKRNALLFQNHIERLNAIGAGMSHWTGVNQDILSRDATSARQIAERIRRHQERFAQILTALQSSLSGIVPKVKQEVGAEANRFLDPGSGNVMKDINAFIAGQRFDPETYAEALQAAGFSQTLYQVFQEFKQALDTFITEQVNPEIIRFIASQETRIRDQLESVAAPYKSLIEDAYAEFCSLMAGLGISIDCRGPGALGVPSVESLLRSSGLRHPPLASAMNYTARIRTEAILRLGFYRLVTGFKKVLKKPVRRGEEDLRALKEGMARIRRETQNSLLFHLKDYQENLKFKYLFQMIEMAAERLSQAVTQQLQAYSADFGALSERVIVQQGDKERAAAVLEEMSRSCRRMGEQISRLKHDMSTPPVDPAGQGVEKPRLRQGTGVVRLL